MTTAMANEALGKMRTGVVGAAERELWQMQVAALGVRERRRKRRRKRRTAAWRCRRRPPGPARPERVSLSAHCWGWPLTRQVAPWVPTGSP